MSSKSAKKSRGRPPNFTLNELLRVIMRESWRSNSSWVSQQRLRFLTGVKKSTLSTMIRKLRKRGLVTTKKTRMGKCSLSFVTIAFRKRFVTDLSKIQYFKGVLEHPAYFIGTEPPTHVFGQLPEALENNIYIAADLKEYLRTHASQERDVLELIPTIPDISPDESLEELDINFQSALVAKRYIRVEGGQEDLVLALIPATKFAEDLGVVEP